MNLHQPHPNRLNYIRFPSTQNEFEFPGEIVYLIHSDLFESIPIFLLPTTVKLEPCSLTDANAAKLERWAKVSKIWQQPNYLELSIHPSACGGIQSGKRDAVPSQFQTPSAEVVGI
jgi:hypothetical protein